MILLRVKHADSGGRLDKYILKFLKEAPSSFVYKMLRKKNIVLNGKKASGSELLKVQDEIKLFLSDETILKFGGSILKSIPAEREYSGSEENFLLDAENSFYDSMKNLEWKGEEPTILYEDAHILILNKPVDVLSQIAKQGDYSVNEWISHYLIQKGEFSKEDFYTMKPAVVNRLDRNTSGIILAGKSLVGLRFLSELIKDRKLKKYYLTIVKGCFQKTGIETAYLLKNENHNTVKIYDEEIGGSYLIKTAFTSLALGEEHSLLKVELITGKSHQIRAHLHHLGFPIVGDGKYGLKSDNLMYKRLGLRHQFLHSFELRFPKIEGEFSHLSEKIVKAPLSDKSLRIFKHLGFKEEVLKSFSNMD